MSKPESDALPPPPKSRLRRALRVLRRALLVATAVFVAAAVFLIVRTNLTADRGFDVVLITLDTQRTDHLGCYGSSEVATPHIDALAASGVLFENVIATIPRTTQNVMSIGCGSFQRRSFRRSRRPWRDAAVGLCGTIAGIPVA